MSETEHIIPRRFEVIEPGDYKSVLMELDSHQLLDQLASPTARSNAGWAAELLNKSFRLFGKGYFSSQFALEVLARDTETSTKMSSHSTALSVKVHKDGFEGSGYALGFNVYEPESMMVITFVDDINPSYVAYGGETGVFGKFTHIPIMLPHNVSIDDGYELEFS